MAERRRIEAESDRWFIDDPEPTPIRRTAMTPEMRSIANFHRAKFEVRGEIAKAAIDTSEDLLQSAATASTLSDMHIYDVQSAAAEVLPPKELQALAERHQAYRALAHELAIRTMGKTYEQILEDITRASTQRARQTRAKGFARGFLGLK